MGDVTALMMDVITEKSGHAVAPLAVSVCLTPAAPSPLPIPYPVFASSVEGIGDAPLRTKINGARIATVGSVLKTCHGNEPGTLKEVVSLNTTGPVFLVLGAPIVLCELGMMGITGSLCISNKAPTPGAGGSASDAGGSGGPSGGGSEGSGSGGDASGPGGPGGGGGAGGGGDNAGASGPGASSGAPSEHQCQDGHPVDVVTGYVVDEAIDITLPGVIPLVWKRTYSSSRRNDSGASLGPGWAHGFEQRIVEEERALTLREAEGRSVWFARVKPGESTFHRRERLTLTRDAGGRTYRVYSHKTRHTQVFKAEADQAPALLCSVHDAWGNAITLEHDGPRLTRIVDTAGREVRVAWKEERITRLEVRAEGRLEQWVDYAYSAARCLPGAIDALGGAEEFEYDRFHRMTAAVIKTGVRFEYEYEANTGRCKKTWGPKGLYAIELRADKATKTTHVDGEEPRVITWNDQGLATREALPDGTVLGESAYDEGFLVARVNGAGEGEQYWYDERGNQVRVIDAMGNSVTVDYDDRDLPVRRTTADGQSTSYTYDDRGAPRGVVRPSGEARFFSHDARGRLIAIHDQRGLQCGLEYDARHNLIAETDARGARTTYGYDAMGRPIMRTDALGRVTRAIYDRLGFRVSTRFPDGTTLQQGRDARGRVVREVELIWDGEALAADLDSNRRGPRCFVQGPGTVFPLLQQENGQVLACVTDHLGTPKELIDLAGRVAWAARHSAWGQVIETSAVEPSAHERAQRVESPFRLLGQIADEETGLCWTRYRCFDPEVGRWLSADPLGIAGGADLFGFGGSPTDTVDPLGLTESRRVRPGGAAPGDSLERRGTADETAESLGAQAASARNAGFPHGVSVTSRARATLRWGWAPRASPPRHEKTLKRPASGCIPRRDKARKTPTSIITPWSSRTRLPPKMPRGSTASSIGPGRRTSIEITRRRSQRSCKPTWKKCS